MRWTIRDLLFVMVIVGLALGWWVEHRSHAALQREYQRSYSALDGLMDMLHQQGFQVQVGWESIRITNTKSPNASKWNGGLADYRNRHNPFDALGTEPRPSRLGPGAGGQLVLDPTAVFLLAMILFVGVFALVVIIRLTSPKLRTAMMPGSQRPTIRA